MKNFAYFYLDEKSLVKEDYTNKLWEYTISKNQYNYLNLHIAWLSNLIEETYKHNNKYNLEKLLKQLQESRMMRKSYQEISKNLKKEVRELHNKLSK